MILMVISVRLFAGHTLLLFIKVTWPSPERHEPERQSKANHHFYSRLSDFLPVQVGPNKLSVHKQ